MENFINGVANSEIVYCRHWLICYGRKTCFHRRLFVFTRHFTRDHNRFIVTEINSEQVDLPGYSIIKQTTLIYLGIVNLILCLLRIKRAPSFSQVVGKYHKGTRRYLRNIDKCLTEHLILQGCSEFIFSIKIQNNSISQAKRCIFNKTHIFASVPPLSIEQHFFLAEVLLFRTPKISSQRNTADQLFTELLQVAAFESELKSLDIFEYVKSQAIDSIELHKCSCKNLVQMCKHLRLFTWI